MTQSKNKTPFGLHLMVELYDCDKESLNNQQLVYKILDELPNKIGMKKLIKPYVVFAEANQKRDPGGWSGFVIIQESHISIHTFVKRRFVTADVYSCKSFDPEIAVAYLQKELKTKNIEKIIEIRGKKYPTENIDN